MGAASAITLAHLASFAPTIEIPALNAVAMMSAWGVVRLVWARSRASSKGAHERLGHAHHADRRAVASGPHEVVDDHGRCWAGRLASVQIGEDDRGVEEESACWSHPLSRTISASLFAHSYAIFGAHAEEIACIRMTESATGRVRRAAVAMA
jgi:hypothetical protein